MKKGAAGSFFTPKRRYIHQTFRLIWLDAKLADKLNEDNQNSLDHICHIIDVDSIIECVDVDKCVKLLESFKKQEVFMIVSGHLGQIIMPQINKRPQLVSVFVFCSNKSYHQQWAQEFDKVHGIYTDILSLSKELRLHVLERYENWIPISVLPKSLLSKPNLKEMGASFMCTQLLKENILQNEKNAMVAHQPFASYCRDLGINESNIFKIERTCDSSEIISCYRRDRQIQSLLNWALHINEVGAIYKMRFFINALHWAIEEEHAKQFDYEENLVVYQHHELSTEDCEILKNAEGGLISFNSFFCPSTNRKASEKIASNAKLESIIFSMKINPMISSNSFAILNNKSTDRSKSVILFSSHTIFRIDEVQWIKKGPIKWEVSLSLVSNDEKDLVALNVLIRDETRGFTNWHRIIELLLKLCTFNKAEELCQTLCNETSDNNTKITFYHQLGQISYHKGNYWQAIEFYQKAIEICQSPLPNNVNLAESYMGIGSVYGTIAERSKSRQDCDNAIRYYQNALAIFERFPSPNNYILATLHSRIGDLYQMIPDDVDKAKESYEKALKIRSNTLHPEHPKVAESYNKIGRWYEQARNYKDALLYYERALEILKKAQPPMYPELVTNYKMIGELHKNMNQEVEMKLNFLEAAKIDEKYLHLDDSPL